MKIQLFFKKQKQKPFIKASKSITSKSTVRLTLDLSFPDIPNPTSNSIKIVLVFIALHPKVYLLIFHLFTTAYDMLLF